MSLGLNRNSVAESFDVRISGSEGFIIKDAKREQQGFRFMVPRSLNQERGLRGVGNRDSSFAGLVDNGSATGTCGRFLDVLTGDTFAGNAAGTLWAH